MGWKAQATTAMSTSTVPTSPPRRPLHERSHSQTNALAAIRLVPSTPPRLLGQQLPQKEDIYTRTPLPTHPSHILSPPGRHKGPALDDLFQQTPKAPGTPVSTAHASPQPPQNGNTATGSSTSKHKFTPKNRLIIHKDSKTFSLLQDDHQSTEDEPISPKSNLGKKISSDSLLENPRIVAGRSNSSSSCVPEVVPEEVVSGSSVVPSTPASKSNPSISADPIIANSPWNYQLVGGLRKVPQTPDHKQQVEEPESPELPSPPRQLSFQEPSDGPASHDLSTKPSFRSTETATTSASENANYQVYGDSSDTASEAALPPRPRSSSDSNFHIIGDASSTGSVIHHRLPTEDSENENYEVYGNSSIAGSFASFSAPAAQYSQESLVVQPLQPRAKRSNENFGYYKSRSRETLRTNSVTSISTVLSQKQAARAIVTSGSLIHLPPLPSKAAASSSWADPTILYPPRLHMNEHPHQWSSQLSTVLSESDVDDSRGSQQWSDNGRRSSGLPSSQSRQSHRVLSISSSLAEELANERAGRVRGDSIIAPPTPSWSPHGRHLSSNSARVIAEQDEYGDGITDMQEVRSRPSRTRLSAMFGSSSSDSGRTSTMRSYASSRSRSNSLISSSLPQWAKLYYGSGERRYLGAPGSSTDGTDSRTSSFRSGSPNTDHFPLSIYSPRRRPREINPEAQATMGGPSGRGSMEITPAPHQGSEGHVIRESPSRRFRTWSMSSVWSPHLRLDRRANRRSVWEPPSVNWSTEGGMFGKRNIQIVMFIGGFLFPFAWMIASFLPLPVKPVTEMEEGDHSTSNLDSSNDNRNDYARRFGPMDESRYESAKWWRTLNRWMSLAGILILAAVAVLIVIGLREGW